MTMWRNPSSVPLRISDTIINRHTTQLIDMQVHDAIETRLELREFADEPVPDAIKHNILNAGRLAPSGLNKQHWQFILIDDETQLTELANVSPSGQWISGADFAIAVCTDPEFDFHEIDAGRAITHMQFAAWEEGVGSRIYTVDQQDVRDLLDIPDDYSLTLVGGFGYPQTEVQGIKDRKPLDAVASSGTFDGDLTLGE